MVRRKNAEKESYWRDVIKRHSVSSLSIREFCENEDVSLPSFYAWRRKLRERKDHRLRDRNSKRRTNKSGKGGGFVSLRLSDSQSGLEIIHPHGCRVRVTNDVNAIVLRRVLDVLDGRGDV